MSTTQPCSTTTATFRNCRANSPFTPRRSSLFSWDFCELGDPADPSREQNGSEPSGLGSWLANGDLDENPRKAWRELPSSGMEFALAGELRVRPLVLLNRRGGCGGCSGRGHGHRLNAPIRRRGVYAPDIPGLFEGKSHQPEFSAGSQGHAIHDKCRDCLPGRKFIQIHLQSWLQWARKPDATSLRIDHQRLAAFGELRRWIETCDSQRKLGANAGAAASGFVRCGGRLHALPQNSTSASEEFPLRTARKEHEGNHGHPGLG